MSETGSVFQILRALTPLASSLGKGKICGLMALTILMALSELVVIDESMPTPQMMLDSGDSPIWHST